MTTRPFDPAVIVDEIHRQPLRVAQRMSDVSYEEWHVEKRGRFREVVWEKRHNPFAWVGTVLLAEVIVLYLTASVFGWQFPVWMYFGGLFVGAVPQTVFSVYSRKTARVAEERVRRDAMYPPRDYWQKPMEEAEK